MMASKQLLCIVLICGYVAAECPECETTLRNETETAPPWICFNPVPSGPIMHDYAVSLWRKNETSCNNKNQIIWDIQRFVHLKFIIL